MARRTRTPEPAEAETPENHPRATLRLVGQEVALAVAARALRGGRPPQAWLIAGPPGVGKATLAYRIARYLLAHGATDRGAADLAVDPHDPASVQVAAGSHPGLMVLARAVNPETGKLANVLPVAEIRRLAGFFGMTSGAGGWRVAIIDTADDMNDAAANALLKMLEEPPARAMLLLLANAPGRLLPTIRSRCQRLALRPLDNGTVARELAAQMPALGAEECAALARLADGSLGAAMQLAEGEGAEFAAEADRLLSEARQPDIPALFALADRIARGPGGMENFAGFLIAALTRRIRARALETGASPGRWVEAREKLSRSFARTAALNLDPRQTLLSAAGELAAAARRSVP